MARRAHTAPQPQVPSTAPRACFKWNGYTVYRAHVTPTARRVSPTKWRKDRP